MVMCMVFGAGGLPSLPADVPDIAGPAQAAASAAATVPQTEVTTPVELVGPPESRKGSGEPPATEDGQVGKVLAALPKALAAVAPLLGLGPQPIPTQTAAPVAGGQPGSPVGQFAQPFGQQLDIGRLLAALPGIGR